MATAHVSGAAALILSAEKNPNDLSASALKDRILDNVDVIPSLSGEVSSGGRLNVCRAIPDCKDFLIKFEPGFRKVGASGGTVEYDIAIERIHQFASDIHLTVRGLPHPISTEILPNPVKGDRARLTVRVPADARAKPYEFDVLGVATEREKSADAELLKLAY